MRTYMIGAAAVAAATVLGACNGGSAIDAGTAGAANAAGGATTGVAGTTGTPVGGSSSTAGASGLPMAGAASEVGGAPSSGGMSNTAGMASTSGGSVGAAGAGGTSSGAAGGASAGAGGSGGGTIATGPFKILILSTTLEFHHDSIPDCQYMMGLESAKATAQMHWSSAAPLSTTWTADLATDDLAQFTDATLKNYAMVFSCSPTGTVFSNNPKVTNKAVAMAALQHFVEGGGAWGGVHSATDFEKTNGFPWFTNTLAGAYFNVHDNDGTPGTVQTDPTNATSPVLTGVMGTYSTQDEWYKMNRDVSAQPGFKILQRLAADNRPLTWTKEIADPSGGAGGRMFYTVRGHNQTVYKESEFRKIVLQGVLWATRRSP